MKIGPEEVRRVAALARLEFTPAEEELLTVQLDSILHFVEKLKEVDTSAVEPLAHVVDIVNALRDDRIVNQPAPTFFFPTPRQEKRTSSRSPKSLNESPLPDHP